MTDPWFDPIRYSWLFGTVYGVSCGLLGSLTGVLAPLGKGRKFLIATFYLMLVIAVLLLIGGVVGYLTGQPYGVWYGLGLPGVLGVILIPSLLPVVYIRYREAEERKMDAQDLE